MSWEISDEEEFLYHTPFATDLMNYAKDKHIRLGSFRKCIQVTHIKEPASYVVYFCRVAKEGFYEKVCVAVQESENGFHYSISAAQV